jgi:hypothetical protein
MKPLKIFGFAVAAAMALSALSGAGVASATELYKHTTTPRETLGAGTEIARA